jgi:hypothetical protein
VIRAPSAEDALAAVEAMRAGGIDVVELTMTVPSAVKVIEKVLKRHGDTIVVGGGTVLDAAFTSASRGSTPATDPVREHPPTIGHVGVSERDMAAIRTAVVTPLALAIALTIAGQLRGASRPIESVLTQPPPPPQPPPVPELPPRKVRCCVCAMHDAAVRERRHQKVIKARFLGVSDLQDASGRHTKERCRPDLEVAGTARFALVGENPWPDSGASREALSNMRMLLPCPELSRAAYKKMFNIDYDYDDPASSDSLGDPPSSNGLGTAPVLRRGHIYQLRVVDREHMLVINETAELYGILLAVDSL